MPDISCQVLQLGIVDYPAAVELQERLVDERQHDQIGDTLVLLQHPPVLTLGRRAHRSNILAPTDELRRQGISVFETNRGGDVTYHGPGQLVGYPILRLADHGNDVHRYLRMLEQSMIALLRTYAIQGEQQPGYTGVWIGQKKIAAIGVAVRGGITMHGFALNVEPNLAHFQLINPCGYTDRPVTSMAAELGRCLDFESLQRDMSHSFGQVFRTRMFSADQDMKPLPGRRAYNGGDGELKPLD